MALQGSYRNAFEDTGDVAGVDATPSGLSNLAVDPVTTSATTAGGLASAITPEQAEMERRQSETNAQAEREYAAQQKAAADNVTDLGNGTFRLADGRIFDSSGNLVTDTTSGLSALSTTTDSAKGTDVSGLATDATAGTAATAGTLTALAQGDANATSSSTSNAYFNANPDVAAAYAANPNGMTPEQYAQSHYQSYGSEEGRESPFALSGELAKSTDLKNGTYLTASGAIVDSSGNAIKDTGSAATATLTNQILAQNLTDKWQGEGFGTAQANAADMAGIMASIGITDINQFGEVPVLAQVEQIGQKYNGQNVSTYQNEDGTTRQVYWRATGQTDQDGNAIAEQVELPKDAKIETIYGLSDGNDGFTQVDSSKVKTVDGKLVADTGQKTYGNKETGQAVPNTYSERQTGNAWGGTFAGDGNTGYRVQFKADGTPIFYTTKASSNDLANLMQDLGPLGQIAIAVATGGLSIPQQIAANLAIQVLSGKDIDDAIKGAAISYAGAQIPGLDALKEGTNFIKDLGLSAGVTDTLTRSFQNAAVAGGKALLSGQNLGDAMIQGAITGGTSGAVNTLMGNIEGFDTLTDSQKKMVTNAVTGVVSGQPLDQIVINTAIAAANAEVAKAKGVSEVPVSKVGDGTSKATQSGLDSLVNKELESALTFDATGSTDVNAAAKLAQDQGYSKFTFDGKSYTIDGNEDAKVADLEKTVKAEQDLLKAQTTAANLAGGEFAGVDQAVANTAAQNIVSIGNAEADTPDEAAALAKLRNPTGNQFTFGGQTYTMGGSSDAVSRAAAEARAEELKNNIANAPSKSEAYKLAREGLGAGQTFTWDGKSYSTNTLEESQAIATAQGDALSAKNLANRTPEQQALIDAQRDTAAREVAARDTAARISANNLLAANTGDKSVDTGGYDALGNPIGGQTIDASADLNTVSGRLANGFANSMTTFLGAVANAPVAAVQAGGNLLGNAGGIIDLVAGKSTEAGNKLRELAGQVDKFSDSISDPQIKIQQKQIGEDIDKADGLLAKTGAMLSAAVNNPLGAANWVFTEGFEEVPGVGMALKAGSKIARYGISIANDMMESGGAAYNDTYKAAKAQGMNEDQARVAARNSSLAAMVATGVTGGVVEGKLLTKAIGKESAGELIEGSAQAAAAQLALGKDLNVNDVLTQGVIEMGVGKGASSTANAVTATNINTNIAGVASSGDVEKINSAISTSVQDALASGTAVNVAVGTSVASAITNGADANSSIITAVTSAIDNGADVNQTITSSITSAISAGADSALSIDSTVTSAITGGADAATTVDSAVTSAMTAGADASTSIASAVQAAVSAGTNVTTATNAATSAAVTSAITGGTDVSTAITNAVSGAVAAGADTTTATTTATGAAVTTAITNGTDASTAITSAVTAAVDAGADVVTASNAAVTSAVTASITNGTDVATAISTAVTAAVDAGSNVTAATNAATTAAVTSAVTSGTDVSTAITNAVNGAVAAGADATTATSTAVTASVTAAITSGANVSTTISNAIQTAVDAGVDTNTVVGNTISAAITAGANVNTAVTTAVTTAINAGSDANTSIATAVNSAITSGVNSTTAINAAVQAAIEAGVDVNTAINTAVNTAVNANTNVTTDANVDANTNVTTNVNADANVVTNANTDANADVVANADLPVTSVSTVTGGLPTSDVLTVNPLDTLDSTVAATSTPSVSPLSTTVSVSKPTVPPRKPTAASKYSPSDFADPTLDSSPQFLKGAPKEKAMQLAALQQLFSSLTPEMQEIFMERGITPPEEEKESEKVAENDTKKKDKKSDEDKTKEEIIAEEDAKLTPEQLAEKYSTKFAAAGGAIGVSEMKDTFNPNLKTTQSILAAAPITEAPFKLSGLKHLKQGISKAPRAVSEYAQGGLPTKYAKAAPKGHNPEFITGLTGYYAQGEGTGQSDDIPAMLHDGDYVIDADAVAALGDGSSKAGAQALSQFQSKVPHKMSTGGQAVPAKIADGEYVFPEAFVTAIGGGDNKQGAKMLDAMREELRAHKRSAPTSKIPPKAKSPLDYLRMAKG